MSWRPTFEKEPRGRDARLDPYRERAAILSVHGEATTTLFVRVETWWTQRSGHLWWTRWSQQLFKVTHGYMEFVDGSFDDWIVGENELDEDVRDWARNKLRYVGQALDVEWLDDSASEHVRVDVLGLDPPSA